MITVKTNISIVTSSTLRKLQVFQDPRPLLRPVALDIVALMTERIHEKGVAADNSKIGTYNKSYLSLRRRKFKRSSDSTIIVSLTRQLENDWAVLATEKGWGVGFNNAFNAQKMKWVEKQKGKKIASLTPSERSYAVEKLKKLVSQELSK